MKTKTVSTRRLFFRRAGAALSVPLGVAAAAAPANASEDAAALKARLAELEDIDAIRALQQRYAEHANSGAREAIAALFADPPRAQIDARIRGLSAGHFGARDVVELAADGEIATARMHCTVRLETPIEPSCTLVDMARQQGGGVVKRLQDGVLDGVYVKRNGVWKIARLVYRPT